MKPKQKATLLITILLFVSMIKVNGQSVQYSDTAAMLSNYARSANFLPYSGATTNLLMGNKYIQVGNAKWFGHGGLGGYDLSIGTEANQVIGTHCAFLNITANLYPGIQFWKTGGVNAGSIASTPSGRGVIATIVVNGDWSPSDNNIYDLGGTAAGIYRWRNVYAVAGNYTGGITASSFAKSGGTASQILAADGSVLTAGNNITISGGVISASISGTGGSGGDYVPYSGASQPLNMGNKHLQVGNGKWFATGGVGGNDLSIGTEVNQTMATNGTYLNITAQLYPGIQFWKTGGVGAGSISSTPSGRGAIATLVAHGDWSPVENNTYDLGGTAAGIYRWRNVYAVGGNYTGSITANSFAKSGGTASQILAADGSVLTAGNNITINGGVISASLSGTGGSGGDYVPYNGASQPLNMGNKHLQVGNGKWFATGGVGGNDLSIGTEVNQTMATHGTYLNITAQLYPGIQFWKTGGVAAGSISSTPSGRGAIATLVAHGDWSPMGNDTYDLGGTAAGLYRWRNVYAVGGNYTGSITANSFAKSGGTGSQILAADGSVLTAGSNIVISGGVISALSGGGGGGSSYLPLTAGSSNPLTGQLFGTDAKFSGILDVGGSGVNFPKINLYGLRSDATIEAYGDHARLYIKSANNGQGGAPSVNLSRGEDSYGIFFVERGTLGGNVPMYGGTNSGDLVLGSTRSVPLKLGTNNQSRMVLDVNGNVGIGVASPSQKLQVDGNISAGSFIKSGGTASQVLAADGSVLTAGDNISINSGVISSNITLTNHVPYNGATADLNMYDKNVSAASFIKSGGTASQVLAADGSVLTAGNNISINSGVISSNITLTNHVPYNGATADLNMYDKNVSAASFIKSGGTASQVLAADGSVLTAGNNISINGGVISSNISMTNYVPYTGATSDLNMGSKSVRVGNGRWFGTGGLGGNDLSIGTEVNQTFATYGTYLNITAQLYPGIQFWKTGGVAAGSISSTPSGRGAIATLVAHGDWSPMGNDTYDLGGTAAGLYRWRNVYAVNGNYTGSISASSFAKSGGTASQVLAADGSVLTAGNNISINGGTISANINLSDYVPYTGAASDLNLGTRNISAASFVKSGGTAAQVLAADGSVLTAGNNISISGGTISSNFNTSDFLPRAAGPSNPLTGQLVGPSAKFSGTLDVGGSGVNFPKINLYGLRSDATIEAYGDHARLYLKSATNGLGGAPSLNLSRGENSYGILFVERGNDGGNVPMYGGTNSGDLVLGSTRNVPLRFGTNNLSRMVVDENGNVGIGVASPTEKLSVEGNIRTRKLIVTQLGWADYVFDEKYKLRSLASLEAFIKENKHLPEVPSAKEVEEKGISVGENQVVLLKKIEELTLYILDMDKRMQKIEAENNDLKKTMGVTKKNGQKK